MELGEKPLHSKHFLHGPSGFEIVSGRVAGDEENEENTDSNLCFIIATDEDFAGAGFISRLVFSSMSSSSSSKRSRS